ncbi:hypothetical protein CYMTET_38099 [Cymbomonas tetramitiformis]|uniref:GRAM domain-containing protein n=1 Tax=Cymbomonas tetramitiformis TaxID=36881 RepID=A0AAE0CCM6_9CHLO|nr:hypothetical protein CYMTET_38100 [Cymbomonas tetramitiformis]KAK3252613.1 hypothetical protein CYMTET_38099 [Cymbomonas tetramitiformis]
MRDHVSTDSRVVAALQIQAVARGMISRLALKRQRRELAQVAGFPWSLFNLNPKEKLVDEYACELSAGPSSRGKLYMFSEHLCFVCDEGRNGEEPVRLVFRFKDILQADKLAVEGKPLSKSRDIKVFTVFSSKPVVFRAFYPVVVEMAVYDIKRRSSDKRKQEAAIARAARSQLRLRLSAPKRAPTLLVPPLKLQTSPANKIVNKDLCLRQAPAELASSNTAAEPRAPLVSHPLRITPRSNAPGTRPSSPRLADLQITSGDGPLGNDLLVPTARSSLHEALRRNETCLAQQQQKLDHLHHLQLKTLAAMGMGMQMQMGVKGALPNPAELETQLDLHVSASFEGGQAWRRRGEETYSSQACAPWKGNLGEEELSRTEVSPTVTKRDLDIKETSVPLYSGGRVPVDAPQEHPETGLPHRTQAGPWQVQAPVEARPESSPTQPTHREQEKGQRGSRAEPSDAHTEGEESGEATAELERVREELQTAVKDRRKLSQERAALLQGQEERDQALLEYANFMSEVGEEGVLLCSIDELEHFGVQVLKESRLIEEGNICDSELVSKLAAQSFAAI